MLTHGFSSSPHVGVTFDLTSSVYRPQRPTGGSVLVGGLLPGADADIIITEAIILFLLGYSREKTKVNHCIRDIR